MAAAVEAAREALIEMVAEADEKLMEKFFEAGTLTDEELVQGLRAATIAGEALSAGVHVRAAQHRHPAVPRRDRRVPAVAGRSAVRRDAVKTEAEVSRPADEKAPAAAFVWKTIADPFAGRITMFRVVSGIAQGGLDHPQQDARHGGAPRPPAAAPGQDADDRAGDQGGRPRRRREAEGHAHERHARREERPGHLPGDHVSRAGALVRDRAEEPRRRGQDQHVDAPARGRGSVDPVQPRSADERAAALGPGPAAHRGDGREAETALRRRREPQAAAHPVPRDDQGVDRGARPPQETDRRPRPVRRLQDQGRAAGARRRLRVRRRHLRRLDSAPVRPGGREGHPGRAHARLSRRLPDGRLPRHRVRRLVPRRRFERAVVQDWPAHSRSRTR